MDLALAYLQRIHTSVITVSADGTSDPMEIAKRAAALLGLPPQVVTPLLARTFAANIRVRDHQDLVNGT
jgi:hydroxyacylglutathione hydrolase